MGGGNYCGRAGIPYHAVKRGFGGSNMARLAVSALAAIGLIGGLLMQPGRAAADDPAFVTLGLGGYDVFQKDEQAVDFRVEYRHNEKLWIFKPWAGIEATSDGAVYGAAGVLVDLFFGRRVVLTPSFGAGAYHDGGGKELGFPLEFRSQVELAYRFNDRSRLGVAIGHISNASLGSDNPGTEIVTLYYSIPFEKVFPPTP